VIDIDLKYVFEMAATTDQDPIQTLTPDGADETLGVRVGSGRQYRCADHPKAFAAEHLVEGAAELRVAIPYQEPTSPELLAHSEFLADPALANGELFRVLLAAHGVTVNGPTVHGVAAPDGTVVASLTSAPVSALLTDTLLRSDNMRAEELLKEVGHTTGAPGSTASGLAVTRAALAPLCVPLAGADDDGSGLSTADGRSPREWRELLQEARAQPWWPLLRDALPLAGRSGTLSSRFRGTPADGNVRAKTGTIPGGIALSGYGTTAGGRGFVFSVLVNGGRAPAAERALDALIAAVAAHPG
jgi:D-alanyl-D-alanine carboxypeptidase/D-alanyl-D-alanine-endopeptidase (penicillin-binding protein 4)